MDCLSMRFEIDAKPSHGIRLIPNLPDHRLCRLEGFNGVGKTATIRILQLATGEQPFVGSTPSWQSLKNGLGRVHIKATNLTGAGEVSWVLNPDDWPDEPEPVGDWIGTIHVDSTKVSIGEIRKLVRVFRVAGDENLSWMIANQIVADAGRVRRIQTRYEGVATHVDSQLEVVASLLRAADPRRIREVSLDIEARESQLTALKDRLKVSNERLARLEETADHQARLTRLVSAGSNLKDAESSLEQQLHTAESRIKELSSSMESLREKAERDAVRRKELASVENLLRHRSTRYQNRLFNTTTWAAALGVEPTIDAVSSEIEELDREVKRFADQRRSLDVTPQVCELIGEVQTRLRQASASELDSETIMIIQDADVSVRDAEMGLETQRRRLVSFQPPLAVTELDAEIAQRGKRRSHLERLLDEARKADRDAELLAEARSQMSRLSRSKSAAAEEYRRTVQELESTRELVIRLTLEHAEARRIIQDIFGGASEESLRARLANLLQELEVRDGNEIPARIENAISERNSLTSAVEETESVLRSLRKDLSLLMSELQLQVQVLSADSRVEWLRKTVPQLIPSRGDSDDQLLPKLVALSDLIDGAQDLLSQQGTELQGTLEALHRLAASLRDRSVDVSALPNASADRIERLRTLYEAEFAQELGAEEIAAELFDRGRVQRVDLNRQSITWTTSEGLERTRPLEAFSSGERAFGYTRARLQRLPTQGTLNTVVALDEFGSFLAYNRLEHLEAFISRRVLGKVVNQVILILPLRRDYLKEWELASPERKAVLDPLVKELRSNGYIPFPA